MPLPSGSAKVWTVLVFPTGVDPYQGHDRMTALTKARFESVLYFATREAAATAALETLQKERKQCYIEVPKL